MCAVHFGSSVDFSAARPPLPMRKVVDPSWACGFGFGAVKRQRTDLVLPWEDPVFSFVAQETSFLDELQETLLEQPEPVPLPAPAETKDASRLTQSLSLPQPKLRSLSQWKPQDSQAERQAALSKWSQLLRAVPHFFLEETQPPAGSSSPTQSGRAWQPRPSFCKEEHKHSSQPCQQSTAFRSLEGEILPSRTFE